MPNPHVLIVEDNTELLKIMEIALRDEQYEISMVSDGLKALERIRLDKPDLVVLDIMLPGLDGISICRILRNENQFDSLPIILISARGQTDDVVAGLDAGADDYITKPFVVNELRARVRAISRRERRLNTFATPDPAFAPAENVLRVGNLVLEADAYQVRTPARTARLTATEHRLLSYMMNHAEQVLSSGLLLEEVWSYPPDTGDPDLVRAHMRKLRNKIEQDPNNPVFIHTVHGVGYMVADKSGAPPLAESK
ncbi:MAG: response regulator transcription factor [Anaerolineae bacterium]|nr:response regulator transcription factor [Anaerolineae bacterium]